MFDAAITKPLVADWRTQLSSGDIVALALPRPDKSAPPQAKPSPWLVLDVKRAGGRRFALVAPGISAASATRSGYEVRTTRPEAVAAAGLDEPMWFEASQRLLISLASARFHPGPNGSPALGRLPDGELRRMNRIRARLQAEADIAADRRERRRAATARPTLAMFGGQAPRRAGVVR